MGNFKKQTSNDQEVQKCCKFFLPSKTSDCCSWSVVVFWQEWSQTAGLHQLHLDPRWRWSDRNPKRWVEVENFPTAAQKVFGPGTPKDQEKFGRLLHGSHLNLNIQLPDTNLGTGRKRSCNGNFEMTFNERDDFVKAVFSNSPHLCENVVRLAEKPSRICIGRHKEFECTDVDVCAKGPEVRFLKVIDPLKLLDLQRTLLVSKCNLRFFWNLATGHAMSRPNSLVIWKCLRTTWHHHFAVG